VFQLEKSLILDQIKKKKKKKKIVFSFFLTLFVQGTLQGKTFFFKNHFSKKKGPLYTWIREPDCLNRKKKKNKNENENENENWNFFFCFMMFNRPKYVFNSIL